MNRIDTHQHLLYPDRFRYAWTDGLPPLAKRPFTLEEYRAAAQGTGIDGTIFMEVDVPESDSAGEAAFFCQLASDPRNQLLGVIASGRPENHGFASHVERIRHAKLVGLRRILHVVPDEVSQSSTFRANVAALGAAGLTFDLCMLARQLPLAAQLADACPNTRLVLDHCGVPDIAGGEISAWRSAMQELAKREHLACKISGIIAYAAADQVSADTFRPYVEHVIACFGWDRVVFGGDWPVCNLTGSLRQWCDILDAIVANESASNRARLFAGNARAIYRV